MKASLGRALSKPVKELVAWAEAQGWTVTLTRGGHLRYTHPNVSGVVFGAQTPSDHRGVRNAKARLDRALRRGTT